MAKPGFDPLRALAIASQAIGFVMILTLETWLGDAARPWEALVLALMLLSAVSIALLRRYRRNKARKAQERRD